MPKYLYTIIFVYFLTQISNSLSDIDEASFKALLIIKRYITKIINEQPSNAIVSNGFVDWPSPNGYYDICENGLILETYVPEGHDKTNKRESISSIYSPFGQVKLLGSGFQADIDRVSATFLAHKSLNLKEVTDECKIANGKGKITNPPSIPWKNSGLKIKRYQILKAGNIKMPDVKNYVYIPYDHSGYDNRTAKYKVLAKDI